MEVFDFDPLLSNNLDSDESTYYSSRNSNNLSAFSQKINKKHRSRYSNKTRKYQLRRTKKKYQQTHPGICKYINKGSDQATVALENRKDEVTIYISGRYISSSEAQWHILEFANHESFPTVFHLAIHLKNGQRLYFN